MKDALKNIMEASSEFVAFHKEMNIAESRISAAFIEYSEKNPLKHKYWFVTLENSDTPAYIFRRAKDSVWLESYPLRTHREVRNITSADFHNCFLEKSVWVILGNAKEIKGFRSLRDATRYAAKYLEERKKE